MRYSPSRFGGRRKVHSVLSPAMPFEKVVVLKENHVLEGRTVKRPIKV